MPWIVGIDEAGYGPNLGPLVQAAVAVKLPEADPAGWATLKDIVHRVGEKANGRLLIDDSKKVHSGKNGFAKLQKAVSLWFQLPPLTFAEVLAKFGLPNALADAIGEAWFRGNATVPGCERTLPLPEEVQVGPAVVNLVQTPRFNKIVDQSGSKATVLTEGLLALLAQIMELLPDSDDVRFLCDKQGGRTYYAPLVQTAFPMGWVHTDFEKPDESRYRVENLSRRVVVSFRPKADSECVAVAVASLLCKFLREVCMEQFNEHWAKLVPELKPTAGYPLDAKRFFADIQAHVKSQNLDTDTIWRKK